MARVNAKNNGQFIAASLPKRSLGLQVVVFILVVTVLVTMTFSISSVVRGLEGDLVWPVLLVAFVVGWGVAKYARKIWSVIAFSLTGGFLFSALMVGRLWDEMWLFWKELFAWSGNFFQAVQQSFSSPFEFPSIGTLVLSLLNFTDSVYAMFEKAFLWVWRFPNLNSDLIATLMVWSFAIWLVTIWASWFMWRRRRPLEGIVPAFLLVGLSLSYANSTSNAMLVMLGAAIALMIFAAQLRREDEWSEGQVGYSELIRKNSIQAALMLSLGLVVASAGITSIDVNELIDRWEDFRRQRTNNNTDIISDSLAIERNPEIVPLVDQFGKISRGGLPSDHLIGSGPELAEQVVMVVRVEEVNPSTGDKIDVEGSEQRYYFRSVTYDNYTAQGWYTQTSKIYVYRAEQEAIKSYTPHQRLIKQEVRFEDNNNGIVYAVGELAVVNREYSVAWRQGTGLSLFNDMFGAIIEDNSYQAYSIVPLYSEEEMRNSFENYPDWVTERYLDLPPTVPERVLDLAYELTYKERTAYDKAVAIEQYLRTFPYTLDLPIKPSATDIADYFLFDIQKGYCDYYSSTMVVLARAVGLPARLAVGYVGGTYDEENDYYVVTADQAHSWVEIYFPEFGWVPFEPTASQEQVIREEETPELAALIGEEGEIVFEPDKDKLTISQIVALIIFVPILLGLIVGFIWLRVEVFLLRQKEIKLVFAMLYHRMLMYGRWLGVPEGPTQTPLEFTARMQARLDQLHQQISWLGSVEEAKLIIKSLAENANRTAYSEEAPDVFDRGQSVRNWVLLRRHLLYAVVLVRISEWWGKIRLKKSVPANQ